MFPVTDQANTVSLSLASKRLAQNEAGSVVLDEPPITCLLDASTRLAAVWLDGVSLAAQPRVHLLALYDGWIACLEALLAAKITGKIALDADSAAQKARRQALADHARLQRDIAALRAQAGK